MHQVHICQYEGEHCKIWNNIDLHIKIILFNRITVSNSNHFLEIKPNQIIVDNLISEIYQNLFFLIIFLARQSSTY